MTDIKTAAGIFAYVKTMSGYSFEKVHIDKVRGAQVETDNAWKNRNLHVVYLSQDEWDNADLAELTIKYPLPKEILDAVKFKREPAPATPRETGEQETREDG